MRAERVLLVDDHAAFRESAAALLGIEGLPVTGQAASGEEALELFGALEPDLVLLDLLLPGMDGVDVAWLMAARTPATAIILISSHEEAAADPRVEAAPVKGFIAKRDLTLAAICRLLD